MKKKVKKSLLGLRRDRRGGRTRDGHYQRVLCAYAEISQ